MIDCDKFSLFASSDAALLPAFACCSLSLFCLFQKRSFKSRERESKRSASPISYTQRKSPSDDLSFYLANTTERDCSQWPLEWKAKNKPIGRLATTSDDILCAALLLIIICSVFLSAIQVDLLLIAKYRRASQP